MTHILSSFNPHDGSLVGDVSISSREMIEDMVKKSHAAQKDWAGLTLQERMAHLKEFRDTLWEAKDELAEIATKEMGMPISFSKVSVERGFSHIDWKLDNAEKAYKPVETLAVSEKNERNYVTYEPYGVCAAIAPWNFPMTNFIWATYNALLAGNAVIYKASEETPLFSKKIEELVEKSTLPECVLQIIYGAGEQAEILVDQDVNLISFTGSTRVGKILAKKAAEKFIPALLEMGGSDPGVIFEDANIDMAVSEVVSARFNNSGQICCSLKRLIVHRSIYDDVVTKLKEKLSEIKVGDPSENTTAMGPLCAPRFQQIVQEQVQNSVKNGAVVEIGGNIISEFTGSYYQPTLLTNIHPNMRVWREEVFGPVLPIVAFDDYEEAIELANDTEYGLGANIFTENTEIANKAARDIQAGMVRVNATLYNRPCNPFGGYKLSGLGRTNGMEGFHEVVQVKLIAHNL